jgi:DNA-binding MarR family transcriptional regulator
MPSAIKKSIPAVDEVDTSYLETLVGYNARRAALAIIGQFVEHMAVYELNPVEFSVMSVVVHNPGVTSRQLCAALNILPPNLVGLVQLLETRRLIERKPHPHDGRAVGLHPTQVGEALMAKAEVTARELEMNTCSKLTPNQIQNLVTLLQKIYL